MFRVEEEEEEDEEEGRRRLPVGGVRLSITKMSMYVPRQCFLFRRGKENMLTPHEQSEELEKSRKHHSFAGRSTDTNGE
jgi:hypothetical protein